MGSRIDGGGNTGEVETYTHTYVHARTHTYVASNVNGPRLNLFSEVFYFRLLHTHTHTRQKNNFCTGLHTYEYVFMIFLESSKEDLFFDLP